jgi:chromosome transmission fidelity protein 18
LIYEPNLSAGCFGHYATLRQHDANLSRHEQANEWLATFDTFSSAMYSDGDFALNQYLPYALVPFYPLFQERGGDRVERNQADWDVSSTLCKAILLLDFQKYRICS